MPKTDAEAKANETMDHHFERESNTPKKISLSEMLAFMRTATDINDNDEGTDFMEHNTSAITWDAIKRTVKEEQNSQTLMNWIGAGCQGPLSAIPNSLKPYWRVSYQLRIHNGVPMM